MAPPPPGQALEGSISAALVTPDLRHAGTFRASFLVVSALPHPANNLGNLQRMRWVPGGSTLDIGCARGCLQGAALRHVGFAALRASQGPALACLRLSLVPMHIRSLVSE